VEQSVWPIVRGDTNRGAWCSKVGGQTVSLIRMFKLSTRILFWCDLYIKHAVGRWEAAVGQRITCVHPRWHRHDCQHVFMCGIVHSVRQWHFLHIGWNFTAFVIRSSVPRLGKRCRGTWRREWGISYRSIRRRPTDSFRREIISRVKNSDRVKNASCLK
jgi:hypothetical protein